MWQLARTAELAASLLERLVALPGRHPLPLLLSDKLLDLEVVQSLLQRLSSQCTKAYGVPCSMDEAWMMLCPRTSKLSETTGRSLHGRGEIANSGTSERSSSSKAIF